MFGRCTLACMCMQLLCTGFLLPLVRLDLPIDVFIAVRILA